MTRRLRGLLLSLAVLAMPLSALAAPAPEPLDLEPFLRRDAFEAIRLSPKGDYYAATVPLPDRTVLVVIRRSDQAITAKVTGGEHSDIAGFWWVDDDRLVVAMARRFGRLEEPQPTGELHALNADGTGSRVLVGLRTRADAPKSTDDRRVREAARLVDTLPGDPRHVLIAVEQTVANPLTHIERLDVHTGERTVVARAPVRRALFAIDAAGVVRFAQGAGPDNFSKLYYRDGADDGWRLVNDAATSGRAETPLGFSADGRTAYLRVDMPTGPDAVEAFDTATGTRTPLLRDDAVDPVSIVRDARGVAVGAGFLSDRLRVRFFDEASAEAVRHRALEKVFPDAAVTVTSMTTDGRLRLVRVSSDRNPGDFYLYDADRRSADLVFQHSRWFDPEAIAPTESIRVIARDGLELHGLLVRPPNATGPQPLVVMPHGGPFDVFDAWGFDPEVEMLAQAGYVVLRVDFRGSANRGRAFRDAGGRQWGRAMQDDVTDATRWAIAQGIADPERICIAGASYGGYAALMGLAREPGLYRCAVGYAGVYDLPLRHAQDADAAKWVRTWLDDWVGSDKATLAAISPNRLAERMRPAGGRVPEVLLVAGGADAIAPIQHSKLMEKALRDAAIPVETLYAQDEGHGFHAEENRRAYYTRLLAFLARHLGGRPAR
jgi:dipeptidyl aminopeptidase/acylaminoacyl peptidase